MLVAEEEHEGYWVVKLIHLLEVWHLIEVANVDDGKVLDTIGDSIENLVLFHTVGVPVTTEADDNQTLFLGQDCLINMPSSNKMG